MSATSEIRQRSTATKPAAKSAATAVTKDIIDDDIVEDALPEEQKFIVPNYTNKQLLDAIPAHCFERSAFRSTVTLVQDSAMMAALVYGAYHIDPFVDRINLPTLALTAIRVALWTTYTVLAGFVGCGLWVVGHEAGHQAYSTSKTINNTVGWFVHSALLVPYHSWRISHGRHHAGTGSITRDEVYVPATRSEYGLPAPKTKSEFLGINLSPAVKHAFSEALDHVPIAIFWTAMYQLLGFPLYLIMNAAGQKRYPWWTSHFNPSSVIFRKNHRWQIIISDIGILLVLGLLTFWSVQRSFKEMFLVFGIPYLWVNHWIILITYLQHTDPTLPHYSDNVWTFPRGALSTIDRTFLGPIGAYLVHGLCETHVAHHISSKIPHYHAWEATEALKAFLGPHYQRSEENMLVSLWKSQRNCLFIEDGADIAFYKNYEGVAQRFGVIVDPIDSGVEVDSS